MRRTIVLFTLTSLAAIVGACQAFTGTGDLEVRESASASGAGAAGAGSGSATSAAGGQGGVGGVVGCVDVKECPTQECATYACTDGVCEPTYEPSTITCGPPQSCTDGMQSPVDHCDGAGKCIDSGTTSCDTYVCSEQGACYTSCTIDNQCAAGYSCIDGQCKKPGQGDPCSNNEPCAMNLYCVDGVCCLTMCRGICQTCYGPNSEGSLPSGTCWSVKGGTDPDGECGALKCNGASINPGCM